MANWTDDEIRSLARMSAEGMSITDMALQLGRSEPSIRNKLKRIDVSQPLDSSSDASGFQSFDVSVELDAMKAAALKTGSVDIGYAEQFEQEDPQQLWSKAENDAQKRIDKLRKRSRFKAKFNTEQPVGIAFISDQHIAPGTACNFKKMREDAQLIADTDGLFCCLAGDGVDNHLKIKSALLSARSTPDEQWRLFDYYLQLLSGKVIAMCSGNHDAYSVAIAGTDVLRLFAEKNKIWYCPSEARIDVTVGSTEYKVAFRHQYRFNSSYNQTHCVKQWYRMGDEVFDIGVIGHHHEASIEAFMSHGMVRWAARPGSYQIGTSYTEQYGFGRSTPTCPT